MMVTTTNSLSTTLTWLLEQKSRRDGVSFTSSQLANALNVPRSLIQRLIHPDPNKRVLNPRIDTLLKVVNFFQADGFEINVNDLLDPHLLTQTVKSVSPTISIPMYSFTNINDVVCLFSITGSSFPSNELIALRTEEDIQPIFKSGTVFIINKQLKPENNILIALWDNNKKQVYLEKYTSQGLIEHSNYIGVVIQIHVSIGNQRKPVTKIT